MLEVDCCTVNLSACSGSYIHTHVWVFYPSKKFSPAAPFPQLHFTSSINKPSPTSNTLSASHLIPPFHLNCCIPLFVLIELLLLFLLSLFLPTLPSTINQFSFSKHYTRLCDNNSYLKNSRVVQQKVGVKKFSPAALISFTQVHFYKILNQVHFSKILFHS